MSPTSGGVGATATVIRTKRYVSAPAGVYPAPIPAAKPVQDDAQEALRSVVPAFEQQSAGTAAARVKEREVGGPAPLPERPAPSSPSAASTAAAKTAPNPVATSRSAPVQKSHEEAVVMPRRLPRIIGGALSGGVLGAAVGLLLLAVTNPAMPLERLSEPLRLWNETPDPLMQIGAGALTVGFILLGAGMGARPR